MNRKRDYGDACGAMREAIRYALRHHSYIPGEPHTEALVETLLGMVHDAEIEWAFREIIDRSGTRK